MGEREGECGGALFPLAAFGPQIQTAASPDPEIVAVRPGQTLRGGYVAPPAGVQHLLERRLEILVRDRGHLAG